MERSEALPQDDWDRHWDHYAESAQQNPAQRYRRRLILRRLGRVPERVLDIGSGQGDLAYDIATRFPDAEVLGLEVSGSGVKRSRAKVPRAVFLRRDLLDSSAPAELHGRWATHAVCSEVLEHVDDPVELLRNGSRYIAPTGKLVVTVPGGPMSAFDRHIGHRRHYTASDVRAVLEAAGLIVDDVARAGFPFFNLYRLLVILRGKHLIDDVSSTTRGASSVISRLLMNLFRLLFYCNLDSSPWGWQLVATARLPEDR